MGYAVGALLAGLIGDAFGLAWAIAAVGALTFLSGLVALIFMLRPFQPPIPDTMILIIVNSHRNSGSHRKFGASVFRLISFR